MSEPEDVWQRLRAGNERFYIPTPTEQTRTEESAGPVAVVFRCADAGVASEKVFGHTDAKSIIDVSTWGHVVDTGVLATIDYAVETLHVPLIVVLGHHQCAAMQAALRAWTDGVMPSGASRTVIEQATTSLIHRTGRTPATANEVEKRHVVETSLSLLQHSPIIGRAVNSGRCAIVATLPDPTDGKITAYATIGPVKEHGDHLMERL